MPTLPQNWITRPGNSVKIEADPTGLLGISYPHTQDYGLRTGSWDLSRAQSTSIEGATWTTVDNITMDTLFLDSLLIDTKKWPQNFV